MTSTIGIVGLGAMGLPMARRILGGGHSLEVVPHHNRRPAEQLASEGATVRASPAELIENCDIVLTSVPDVPQVQEVLFGERGIAGGGSNGRSKLFIDLSTINPAPAQEHH